MSTYESFIPKHKGDLTYYEKGILLINLMTNYDKTSMEYINYYTNKNNFFNKLNWLLNLRLKLYSISHKNLYRNYSYRGFNIETSVYFGVDHYRDRFRTTIYYKPKGHNSIQGIITSIRFMDLINLDEGISKLIKTIGFSKRRLVDNLKEVELLQQEIQISQEKIDALKKRVNSLSAKL